MQTHAPRLLLCADPSKVRVAALIVGFIVVALLDSDLDLVLLMLCFHLLPPRLKDVLKCPNPHGALKVAAELRLDSDNVLHLEDCFQLRCGWQGLRDRGDDRYGTAAYSRRKPTESSTIWSLEHPSLTSPTGNVLLQERAELNRVVLQLLPVVTNLVELERDDGIDKLAHCHFSAAASG